MEILVYSRGEKLVANPEYDENSSVFTHESSIQVKTMYSGDVPIDYFQANNVTYYLEREEWGLEPEYSCVMLLTTVLKQRVLCALKVRSA